MYFSKFSSIRHLAGSLQHFGSYQQLRMARSVSKTLQRTPKAQEISQSSVMPLLIDSVQNRLAKLKETVDLGLGPVSNESTDLLEEALIKAITIHQVKVLIGANFRSMSAAHISTCFETINNIVKYSDHDDALKFELLGSKEFQVLTNRALKLARHMEPSEALLSLMTLHKLGISIDTLLAQALMQMVRFSINEYSIDEMHQLANLLRVIQKDSHTKSTLPDAIKLALPYALKNRINNKEMDFNNPRTLLLCLDLISTFGSDRFSDAEALRKILRFVNRNVTQHSLRQNSLLLSYIYSLDLSDDDCQALGRSIASKCIDCIINADESELELLPSNILVNVLAKMRKNPSFYNSKLFQLINKTALQNENFTIKDQYFVALQNWNFKFVDYNLLSRFAQLIEENNLMLFDPDGQISVTNVLQFFTLPSNSQQIHGDFTRICENIRTSNFFRSQVSKSRMMYFYFLKSCQLLNVHLSEDIIQEWFNNHLQAAAEESVSTSKRHIFLKTIALIYQGLLLDKGHQFREEARLRLMLNKLKPYLDEYCFLLINEVSSQTNPITEEVQFILSRLPNKLKLTKNSILPSGLMIDVLACTEDQQSIGFVLMNRRNYCRDPYILNGESHFQLTMLQKSSISPVVIDCSQWKTMGDNEKEHFVKNEIAFAQ